MPDEQDYKDFKTTALRMPSSVFDALHVIAQLENTTVAVLLRRAVDEFIASKRSDPRLAEQATRVKAQIEAEAAARSASLATLFDKPSAETAKPGSRRGRTGASGGDAPPA